MRVLFLLQLFDQFLVHLRVWRLLRFHHFFSAELHLRFKGRRHELLLDPLLSLPPQQSQYLPPLVPHGRIPLSLLLSLPENRDTRRLRGGGFGSRSCSGGGGGGGCAAALRPGYRQPLTDISRHQPGLQRRKEGQRAPQLPGMRHVLWRRAVKHGEEYLELLLFLSFSLDRHFTCRTKNCQLEN